jgi:hypothetical protein
MKTLDLKIVSKAGVSDTVYDDPRLLPLPGAVFPPSSMTFGQVLRLISDDFHATCTVRGSALLAVRASGTMQRYRRVTFYVPWLRNVSEAEIPAWLKANGIQFYDGMTVKYDRQGSWLEFFGPVDQVDLLEIIITPSDSPGPPTKWGMMKNKFYAWRNRTLGF